METVGVTTSALQGGQPVIELAVDAVRSSLSPGDLIQIAGGPYAVVTRDATEGDTKIGIAAFFLPATLPPGATLTRMGGSTVRAFTSGGVVTRSLDQTYTNGRYRRLIHVHCRGTTTEGTPDLAVIGPKTTVGGSHIDANNWVGIDGKWVNHLRFTLSFEVDPEQNYSVQNGSTGSGQVTVVAWTETDL